MLSRHRSVRHAAIVFTAAGLIAVPLATSAVAAGTEASIAQIQGTTWLSPYNGKQVSTTGVVTAVRSFGDKGFWVQDPKPDSDPRTSEAVFVYTGSKASTAKPGDAVSVSGTVKEYYPTNPSDSPYLSNTELTGATVTVNSSDNELPKADVLKPDTLPDKLTAKPGGNIEGNTLAPDTYSQDWWESHEGMRVEADDARVTGPSNEYHELYVTSKPDEYPTPRGGALYSGYDNDPTGVFKVQSLIPFSQRPFPEVNVGDDLTGNTTGVVEYSSYGGYTVQATELGKESDGGIKPEVTRKQNDTELAVSTFNVENLDPTDPQSKFDGLAKGVVDNLQSPDIVNLEEIQDNDGAKDDGVVAADQTLDKFVSAIKAAGGPSYKYAEIDPENDKDGGEPGGNIRVGFLYNADRVDFVSKSGGDSTTPVKVVKSGGKPHLSASPGRVDPTNDAWADTRKPLAGEFKFHGRTVFVIANHFSSKGGDQPTHGRFQPPTRVSEDARHKQAESVKGFVDQILGADSKANVVVAGDLNDFQFSDTVKILSDGGALTPMINTLPENERYSYNYEGKSQVLDHILASQSLSKGDFDVVHINSEFHDQNSDHDPSIARFEPATTGASVSGRR